MSRFFSQFLHCILIYSVHILIYVKVNLGGCILSKLLILDYYYQYIPIFIDILNLGG
jgi:hypothetical protein